MAIIDVTEAQAYFEDQLTIVNKCLGGAANHVVFPDLTPEERTNVITLGNTYAEWRAVLISLLAALAQLIEFGHPVLPTLAVPASMIASITREDGENDLFRALFIPEPVAAKLGKDLFGEPVSKL